MKLVRETLFEAFTDDDSDPIKDMGIGGYSFETLTPGAVIEPKMDIAINRNNNGRFTYWDRGINVAKRSPLVITSIRNYIVKGSKEIKLYKPGHSAANDLGKIREMIKNGDKLDTFYGIHTRLIITEKQFDNKFEITQNGF